MSILHQSDDRFVYSRLTLNCLDTSVFPSFLVVFVYSNFCCVILVLSLFNQIEYKLCLF